MTGRWNQEGGHRTSFQEGSQLGSRLPYRTPFQRAGDRKVSATDLMAEREKYFAEQRQLLLGKGGGFAGRGSEASSGGGDVFCQFLAEREARLRRLGGGLFAAPAGGLLGDQSAFTPGSVTSGDPTSATIASTVHNIPVFSVPVQSVPSTEHTSVRVESTLEGPASEINPPGDNGTKGDCDSSEGVTSERRERVIPIQIIDEPMLPRLTRGESRQESAPPTSTPLPSLFSDLKLDAARPSPFDHARLTANFPLTRLGSAFGDDLLAFKGRSQY